MPHFDTPDARLYFETTGRGNPLLLLSGLNGGTWSWYVQVPYFARQYQVITLDNRGGGRSDRPAGPYTMAQLAADALALLDHLEVTRALVVGISMGGMIAQELALAALHRVSGLVLAGTHCGGPRRIPPPPAVIAALADNEGLTAAEIIDKDLPYFFSSLCRQDCPDILAAYREAQLRAPLQPPEAFAAQLAAIQTFEACSRLPSLTLATLIFAGSEDVIVPPANARQLAELLPQAELVLLAGAGHALQVESAALFNSILDDFSRHVWAA